MGRRLLAAGGFALLAAPLLAVAQPSPPNALRTPAGYVVIRVSLGGAGGAQAAPGGGGAPGGDGGEGQPGPGGPGPGGFPGGRGGFPGGQPGGGTQPADDPARSVVVVVPYTRLELRQRVYQKFPNSPQNPQLFPKVSNSAAGNTYTTYLFTDNDKVVLNYLPAGYHLPTILNNRHTVWSQKRDPNEGKALVDEALSYGQAATAVQYAKEVSQAVAGRKDPPSPSVAAFVKAFDTFKDAIDKPLPSNPEASQWVSRLGGRDVAESAHYAVVHFGDSSLPKDAVDRRLAALENNFRAFYVWHASGGEARPLPDKKLVVVVAEKATDMTKLQAALDGNPMTEAISDAFYSPTHNLVVLSPERRDDIGRAWANYVAKYYQRGYNRDELLKGNPPPPRGGETALDIAQVMTMALVDRLVDEEAVTAMVTREGSRQLFASSGKLNPYVLLPEWVEQGVSNLLNKPKGPYFHQVNGQTKMALGVASGYGSPNYVLVREFAKMQAAKELNPKPEELLMNVLLDKYFDAYRDGKDIDPPPPPAAGGGQALGGPGAGPGGFGPPGGGFGPGGPPGRGGPPGGGFGSPDGGEGEGGVGPGGPGGAGFGQPQGNQQAEARRLKQRLGVKAQATAWGLNYFLARRKTPALFKFYDDLSRMPRDMRLDKQMVVDLFCKEFDLLDRGDATKVNQDEFKRLATDWLDFMRDFSNYGLELDAGGQPGGAPGGPPGGGFPGGFPGGPGGGRG